jgi:hypothetical protein
MKLDVYFVVIYGKPNNFHGLIFFIILMFRFFYKLKFTFFFCSSVLLLFFRSTSENNPMFIVVFLVQIFLTTGLYLISLGINFAIMMLNFAIMMLNFVIMVLNEESKELLLSICVSLYVFILYSLFYIYLNVNAIPLLIGLYVFLRWKWN